MRRLAIAIAILLASPLLAADVFAIRAARLIDGTGAATITNAVVIVTGDTITAVGSNIAVPAGATVIDLGDSTILPGVIDAHVHLIGRQLGEPLWDMSSVRDFAGYSAIRGVGHAEKTLLAGITTVRNVGADAFHDLALRQAINEGFVRGPRMQAAAHSLGITGGHCDDNGYRPGLLDAGPREGIANGPDEVRAAVRYQVKYGADVIKTCATGGVLSEGDAVGTTQEGAKLMAQNGTYLVPTLSAAEKIELAVKDGTLKGQRAEKAVAAATAMRNAIRIAVAQSGSHRHGNRRRRGPSRGQHS